MHIAKPMVALQDFLSTVGPDALLFQNDAAPKIEDLKGRLLELVENMEAIQATADAAERDLTEDETADMKRLSDEFDLVETDIDRREGIAARAERLATSLGRQTEPEPPQGGPDDGGEGTRAAADGARPRTPAQPRNMREHARWGWQNLGSFARGVQSASRNGGFVDPRLVQNAPTTFGTEGVGEDGGFAVPPEFREAIMSKVMGEDTLIGRTDQLTSSGNTLTIPTDETTAWQSSGGIQAFWENEAAQLGQSKPLLDQTSVRLNKLTALVPMTSELLEDAPAMDTYLRRKAPEKIDFKVTNAIFDGTGGGQPTGLLRADSLITVAKEGSQPADTVVFENVNKMYSRMFARWRQNAIWLINQDIEPQLNSLNHPGDSSPVFMPPGGISQAPFGTILGRPIVPTEACKTLGDLGDIVFVDLSQYLTVTKTGGIRAETSIHLWFDYDMTAFRFILRVAGQPWWKAAIDRFNGANTLSWAVALAERA
jgi:HK97 family phage major capsid protein